MTKKNNASHMRKLVKLYQESGQSQKEFAAAHGLKEGKLYYWISKLSKPQQSVAPLAMYDKIGTNPSITLAGCLVHARRKFHESLQSDKKRAQTALALFRKMYLEERAIKEDVQNDFIKRKALRDKKIKPLLAQIKTWIQTEQFNVLPKSPIGKAMTYFVNQYPKLEAIFEDGRIELDNNLIENAIRPMAIGRKNYLFCGSHKAAQNAAMLYSFFGSCKMQNINPREWLADTLQKISDHSIQKLEELLPGYQKNLSM